MKFNSYSLPLVAAVGLTAALSAPACGGTGPVAGVGGLMAAGTGGGGAAGTGATGSGAATGAPEGVPLPFMNGWLNGTDNALGVQGAVFSYSDTHTEATMVTNIDENGGMACISGEAFKVDTGCTVTDPNATDCYGEFWGAAIGFNLNQLVDETTGEGSDPLPFDGSSITAFSFNVSGPQIPSGMRFVIEASMDGGATTADYCTTSAMQLTEGINTRNIADLVTECWGSTGMPMANQMGLMKIAWQVVTNAGAAVPFDYCIDNVIAIQ